MGSGIQEVHACMDYLTWADVSITEFSNQRLSAFIPVEEQPWIYGLAGKEQQCQRSMVNAMNVPIVRVLPNMSDSGQWKLLCVR